MKTRYATDFSHVTYVVTHELRQMRSGYTLPQPNTQKSALFILWNEQCVTVDKLRKCMS